MYKGIKGKKFSRNHNERQQLFKSLIYAMVNHDYIETSEIKAKTIKPILEKLVTKAKVNNLQSKRLLVTKTGSLAVTNKLLELGKLFVKRPGGYLKIIRLGFGQGNTSPKVRLAWVELLPKPEKRIKKAKIIKQDNKKETKVLESKVVTKKEKKKPVKK